MVVNRESLDGGTFSNSCPRNLPLGLAQVSRDLAGLQPRFVLAGESIRKRHVAHVDVPF